jgi:allantoin racemase
MERRLKLADIPPEWCEGVVEADTLIDTCSFGSALPHLEYQFYEHAGIHNIIPAALKAESEGFHGFVIGCFYDPGIVELRELLQIPVTGVGEATLQTAASLSAGKFSVLVGRKKWIPKMADNAQRYGVDYKIASWRTLELTVPEMCNHHETFQALIREGRAAIEEDHAEVICLGCTGLVGQAQQLQQTLGVPVLDPVVIGLKMAEFRADLWRRFQISHSKIGGYEPPHREELQTTYRAIYGTDLPQT